MCALTSNLRDMIGVVPGVSVSKDGYNNKGD
jgi:hypothetical protein